MRKARRATAALAALTAAGCGLFREGSDVRPYPLPAPGDVQQANLLEHPTPIYPKLAINARVQGLVVLEAVITKEGNVDSLRVVSDTHC